MQLPQCSFGVLQTTAVMLSSLSSVLTDPKEGDLPTFPQSTEGCLCRKTNKMNLYDEDTELLFGP